MGFHRCKWDLLFSIMDIRKGFSLAEFMVFKMYGMAEVFSRTPHSCLK